MKRVTILAMDSGEIAILAVASVAALAPWLLEKAKVTLPRHVIAVLVWISIGTFSWGLAKLLWILEPKQLRFVIMSVSGIAILCLAIFLATLWGFWFYRPHEPRKADPSDTTTTAISIDPTIPTAKEEDLSLKPEHPRLAISVSEPGDGAVVGIIIKSIGGTDALNVHLADFEAGGHTISFPHIELLERGDTTFPIEPIIQDFGSLLQNSLGLAMIDGWGPRGRSRVLPDVIFFPGTAVYSDRRGNHFRASWDYKFYPSKVYHRSHRPWKSLQDSHTPAAGRLLFNKIRTKTR
jgi:hypothetical protein